MVNSVTTPNIKSVKISRKEYEDFCKEYVFEQLKGIKFGEAFCDRFGVDDSMRHIISLFSSMEYAKDVIEIQGYVE
jgi:lysine/ornithine N-monooxygenase